VAASASLKAMGRRSYFVSLYLQARGAEARIGAKKAVHST